jgi:hypothetical protein
MQKRRALQDTLLLPPRLLQNLNTGLQSYYFLVQSASSITD